MNPETPLIPPFSCPGFSECALDGKCLLTLLDLCFSCHEDWRGNVKALPSQAGPLLRRDELCLII